MWCDQAKWVLCRALSNLRFVVYLVKQSESFVLLKTSSKSDLRFQRYTQFCPAENNKIQREFHTIIGCISKSIFPTYDSFRLITTQILIIMQGCGHKNSKFGTLGKKSRNKKGETNNNNKIKKINQITTIQFTYGSKLMSFFEGGNTLTRTLSKSAPST